MAGADLLDRFDAVFFGHEDVGENHVHRRAPMKLDRFTAVCRDADREAFRLQEQPDGSSGIGVVVDDEHTLGRAFHTAFLQPSCPGSASRGTDAIASVWLSAHTDFYNRHGWRAPSTIVRRRSVHIASPGSRVVSRGRPATP